MMDQLTVLSSAMDRIFGEPNARAEREEAFDQADVDLMIARTLREEPCGPEEIFSIDAASWDKLGQAARDLAYAKLRATLADALTQDTPANVEAFGRAAMHCARLAMDDGMRDLLREEM